MSAAEHQHDVLEEPVPTALGPIRDVLTRNGQSDVAAIVTARFDEAMAMAKTTGDIPPVIAVLSYGRERALAARDGGLAVSLDIASRVANGEDLADLVSPLCPQQLGA